MSNSCYDCFRLQALFHGENLQVYITSKRRQPFVSKDKKGVCRNEITRKTVKTVRKNNGGLNFTSERLCLLRIYQPTVLSEFMM